MRRRLALLAALAVGITSSAPRRGHPGAGDRGRGAGRPGHAAAVPRARLRRRASRSRVRLDARSVVVRENGLRVTGVRVDPLAGSGLRFGVVLALDASESMTGSAGGGGARRRPQRSSSHRTATEEIGIVAFNGEISVLQRSDHATARRFERTLATQPPLAYGTRIYDAIDAVARTAARREALVRLDRAALRRCRHRQPALARRRRSRRRRSSRCASSRSGFAPARSTRRRFASIAERTGGAVRRGAIGGGACGDLRGARRRSSRASTSSATARRARPMSQVDVRDRGRRARERQRRPTSRRPRRCSSPTTARPISTFLLSGSSPLVLALFFGLLVCGLLLLLTRRPKTTVVDRVQSFANGATRAHGRERRDRRAARSRPATATPPAGGRSSSATSSSRG